MTVDYMVYLFKYDSVHRVFPGEVEERDGRLVINGHEIQVFAEFDFTSLSSFNLE